MAAKGLQALYNLILKDVVKGSGQASGIMSIGGDVRKLADKIFQRYVTAAQKQGVDLDKLSEQELKYTLELNKPKTPKVYSNQEAAKYLEMFLNQNKKGDVVDLTGKKLDTSQGIIGGKSVKELMESGQVQKGTQGLKKSDKVVKREMFEEANKKFNKTDVVADIVTKITSMEPIAAMKEANKVIGREGIYKNLDETQSQKILKDSEDWIFQRDPGDLYDYKNKRPFRDDPDFDPDQGYYTGGRAGYSLGSAVKQATQQRNGIESRLEQLGTDITSAEQMLQQINERLESAGSGIPEGGGASIANYTPQPRPSGPLGGLGSLAPGVPTGLNRDPVTGGGQPFFMGNINYIGGPNDKLTPIDPYRNTQLAGLSQDGQRFDSAQSAFDALAEQTRKYREASPHTRDVFGTELYQGKEGFKNFTNYFNQVNDPNYTAPSPQLLASSQQNLQNALPGLFAQGGRAGYYTGGIIDVEPNLSDIGHGSDALMARTRLVAPNSQATTSTGLNYLLAEDNDNIRVPFSKGKLADVARRKFLKIASGIGAGIGALKTGILGLGEKAAPVVEKTVETVKQSVGSGTTPPPYFFKLVEKIKTLGDDTLATKDKTIAKKYKDYVMEEDFAGNIEIVKKGGDDMFPEDVYMSYKVDEVPIKGKKGSTKVEEYEEFTARPDMEGKMKDVEPGVPDEVVNEGSVFEDNMTEFGMTKKADGGRIGFNKGKLAIETGRKFLEKVFGKETFENMIRNDPEMYRGMLEVVEMFRNRDKEGLKMYLQKFLPHMDDATVEDFIIGSGDTAGIEGQLIRLGSGRDYKGKIEMIKEADNRRKLNALDVSKMKPNAEGGLITMLGE